MTEIPVINPPYNIGDKCEWLYIEPGYWHDEADRPTGNWIGAEVLFWQYSNHGYDVHIRTGFGFPSTWTRWIWVDFDGNGWDKFPDRDVRPDEVAEFCRHRLRKPQAIHCEGCGRSTTDPDKWDPDAKTGVILCGTCWDKAHPVNTEFLHLELG